MVGAAVCLSGDNIRGAPAVACAFRAATQWLRYPMKSRRRIVLELNLAF
jgi:hypothetical protein